jgi:branched-chain amino acid transport system substrate-binding protein
MSLPMIGPVADVSKSGYQGYELWASQVNAAGGLLGRQVKLDMLDDGFDPNQTAADYTRLISQDHVDLLLGTFSSLLNAPASAVAARQGMLYVEPSGGAATLFTRGFTDLFFAQPGTTTSLPDQFIAWITSLPARERPATAAYVTQDDPSASPAVAVFKAQLAALADDGAQFVRSLQKLNYNPKILFQTNAPTDEAYPSAIGGAARALMLEPMVVLLDEPTLGLDPASLATIGESVRAIAPGTTILMVEQNVRFGLSLATHAAVLTAGTAALSGTAAEIAAHPGLMDLFFGDAHAGRNGAGRHEAGTR